MPTIDHAGTWTWSGRRCVRLRLLLVLLVAFVLSAACSGSSPPSATISVPDCTLAAIPEPVQPPAAPNPLDGAGSVVAAAANAGALAGSGFVTPSGEYRYRLPLDVPPGRAGMAPALALTYGSRGRNGILGAGFQLEGLSEIDRCPKTWAVDGVSDGVRLDENDAFCLDGHELVVIGPYEDSGCVGQEYRTEDDSFARIVSCGTGNAVNGFRVWGKDGRIREYGTLDTTLVQIPSADPMAVPPNDNPQGGTVNYAWLLARDQDRAGNAIRYRYGQIVTPFSSAYAAPPPSVEWYPQEIDYTFQESTGEEGYRSVIFDYDKTLRPDPSFSFVAGVQVNVTQRLSGIEMWAPNPTLTAEVWHYDLTYELAHGSGASLLDRVERCGAMEGCLPAKVFGWQSTGGPTYSAPLPKSHSSLQPGATPLVLDLDGDGRDEVLYPGLYGSIYILTSAGASMPLGSEGTAEGGLGDYGSTTAGSPTASPIDLDGDGRDEIVLSGAPPTVYSLASPLGPTSLAFTTSTIPVPGNGAGPPGPVFFADLNGDGLPDLVSGTQSPTGSNPWQWTFEINLVSPSWGNPTPILSGQIAPLTAGTQPTSLSLDQGQHRATMYYGVIQAGADTGQPIGFYLDTAGHVTTAGPPPLLPTGWATPPPPTAFADLNGDGLQEQVLASPGTSGITVEVGGADWPDGINSPVIPTPAGLDATLLSLQVADLDGDGRDDVIVCYRGLEPKAWRVHLDGAGKLVQEALATPPPDAIGDFDGDGLLDIAAFDVATQRWKIYVQTGSGTRDLLVNVSDEGITGPREKVSYRAALSSAPAPAPEPPAPSGCAYPARCMRHGFLVAREHDEYQGDAVVGPAYRQTFYDYEGARFDVMGRGFLGFDTVRQWEPQRQAETVTTYDDVTATLHDTSPPWVYPNAGHPKQVRRAVILPGAGTNARIAEVDYTYQLDWTNGGKTWFVHPSAWTSYEWEQPVTLPAGEVAEHITGIDAPSAATALRTRSATYTYDGYGNVLDARVATTNGVVTETGASYEIDTGAWLVGLVKTRTVASSAEHPGLSAGPRRTDYTYDANGYLCHAYVDQDDTDPSMIEAFTYARDSDGQVRAVIASAIGQPPRTTHVAYDAAERVYAEETWNDLGHAAWSAHDPALGVLAQSEDENGRITMYAYDDAGRPVSRAPEGGDAASIVYSARHDALTGAVAGTSALVTYASGAAARTDTDALGRVVGRGHLGFDGTWIETAQQYDVLGHVVAVSRPGLGAPSSAATAYVYDGLDRLAQVTSPDQQVTTIDSTFSTTTTIDPLGHVRQVERDLDDRVITSTGFSSQGNDSIAYAYGDFNELETTTDADGNVVQVQYDRRGRRTWVSDPDAGVRTFAYDGFSDLVQSAVNGTVTTTYTIDALGRVTAADVSTGESTTWVWDTAPNGLGQLASTTSPDGITQSFSYDFIGRFIGETWTVGGASFGIGVQYEPQAGRLGTISYPAVAGQPPFSVAYDYGPTGALQEVADGTSLTPYWTVDARNEDDRLLQASLGSGLAETRTYDDTTGRLATATDSSPAATALSLAYDYDAVGRVWHRTDVAAGRRETFGYDELDRLREWDLEGIPPGVTSGPTPVHHLHATEYAYDPLGNLRTVTLDGSVVETNRYGESAGPHALTSNDEGSYVYDDRGRQTQAPNRPSVTFTELDLPRTVTTPEGVTSFAYDAQGARVQKSGPAGSVVTIAGLYERRTSGTTVEDVFYVTGPEGVIAQVTLDEGSGAKTTEYLHEDALGSVAAVSSAKGQPTLALYYEPFGARRDVNGNALASVGGDVPLGFTGQRHDDDLGLLDMQGRVYDPSLRRFLTPDPHVTDPLWGQSYNRYSYVVNDPVNLVDPSGLDWSGDPSDPNAPDYSQGCGVDVSCTTGWNGVSVMAPPGQEGSWGSSAPYYPSGGPLITTIWRPISLPVGPTAPATSILGPPTPAALAALGQPFGPLLGPAWVTITPPTSGELFLMGVGSYIGQSVDASVDYFLGPLQAWNQFNAIADNAIAGAKADGALGAVAGAVNTVNPLYGLGLTGTKFAIAASEGDWRGMGANGAPLAVVAGTLLAGGAGAGETAPAIALGLGEHLGEFAESVDALYYWEWEEAGLGKWQGPFEPFFKQASENASSIHFNLTGMDGVQGGVAGVGAEGFRTTGMVTMAELTAILRDPSLLAKTTFYLNGEAVPAPTLVNP